MSTLIRQTEPVTLLHMLSFFYFSWESACNQQRTSQHCPDRGQGFCILEQKENSSYKL
ncbi:unnamed protein product [Staurois parvus]|uniref:Uncharacterized protein n=1 Tax=Staurois parvus TaxID=386267 RepID=A0ABN9FFF4_9NEOB|nr:unnamed protein product [Staurois parvus]